MGYILRIKLLTSVLVIRSRGGVSGLVRVTLSQRKRGASYIFSNRDYTSILRGGRFSLVLLSIVLPGVDNFRLVSCVGNFSAPMVFVATGSSVSSEICKLGLKTSSCVAGPFGVSRLRTEISTMLQECGGTGAGLDFGSVMVSAGSEVIAGGKMRVSLALGRCRVLLLFMHGGGVTLCHRVVCREM